MSDDEAGSGRNSDQADLNAPSAEQAAAVQAHEEDDDVAYDDEPDEADGEGNLNAEKEAEHSAGQIQDQVQVEAVEKDHNKGQGVSEGAATASVVTVPKTENLEAEEWEISSVPDEWKPAPLFKVKNIPTSDNITEQSVQEVLEAADLHVKSVAFDTVKIQDKRVAYVRLQPPPLPWEIKDKQDTDVSKIATAVVKRLKEADPPLQLGDDKLQFDTSHPQVQLFIGNITEEWSDDVSLRNKMEEYGPVERCLVMHSHKGQNKGYAFVEYSVPNGALKCKEGMDKIEAEMRPDFRRKEGLTIQANGRWQQIKLLRAEWAHPRNIPGLYSRVLYITNLTPGFSDISALRQLFEKFGPVNECHLPRNKQTGNSKGFAFVEFRQSIFADAAYRAVDETDQDFMGSKLVVSFANPAKHYDTHAIRPHSTGMNVAMVGGANGKLGLRGSGALASGMLAGRAGTNANKVGFGGRLSPSQSSFANGQGSFGGAGQLGTGGMGFNNDDMAARLQQQTMQMQQQMQLRYQQQMQLTMQQQLRAQQALMQAQLRAAQAQVQQYQEQALQYKTQASQAQLKAQQESEARKRVEAEAQAVAQARMNEKPRNEYASGGLDASYSGSQAAYAAAYGGQAYQASGVGAPGQDAYGANALYSQGFAAASQGWPAAASNGQTATNGAAGMYGAVSGAQQAGYGTGQEAFAQSAGYPSQAGVAAYGAFGQQQTGYGGAQSAYNGVAQGFGSMPMTSGGYGQAAFAQAGMSPYGQTAINFQSGQKRDAGYDQAAAYGGYGAYGGQTGQSGQDYKRQRY
ncbi:hypothetical protein WJX82_004569 [Trebouxia sp. C0006]